MSSYLSWDAVSSSILRGLEQGCPAEVRAGLVQPAAATPTMIRGSLFALMVERRSIDCPEIVRVEGKINAPGVAERVEQLEAEGRIVLRLKPELDAYDQAVGMYEACQSDPRFHPYLNGRGMREVSLVWRDEATGLLCKARPDLVEPGTFMADWKSAVSVRNWPRVVQDKCYHVQAAFHRAGAIALGLLPEGAPYYWLVVRNTAPYATAGVKTCGPTFLAIGEELAAAQLHRWARCLQSGVFPTYPDETVEPLAWYAQLYNQEE